MSAKKKSRFIFFLFLAASFLSSRFTLATSQVFTACDEPVADVLLIVSPDPSLRGSLDHDLPKLQQMARSMGMPTATILPEDFLGERQARGETLPRVRRGESLRSSIVPSSRDGDDLRSLLRRRVREIREQNPNARIAFAYTGHGVNCRDSQNNLVWCLQLGPAGTPALITDQEILEIVQPSLAILDSCFSGRAAREDVLVRNQAGTATRPPILSSASGLQTADDQDGGLLVRALTAANNANGEEACRLDLDGDGQVSLHELGFATAAMFYDHNQQAEVRRANLPPRAAGPTRQLLPETDSRFRQANSQAQVPALANSSSQCWLKLKDPSRCPQYQATRPHGSCAAIDSKLNALRDSAFLIERVGGMGSYFSFLRGSATPPSPVARQGNRRVVRSQPNNIEEDMLAGLDLESPAAIESGQRWQTEFDRSTSFLSAWMNEVRDQVTACTANSLGEHELCSEVRRRRQASFETFLSQMRDALGRLSNRPRFH